MCGLACDAQRANKMSVGAKCKALIDRGRLEWVCVQLGLPQPQPRAWHSGGVGGAAGEGAGGVEGSSRQCGIVSYIDQSVSGENKLLVAGLP